MVDDRESLVAIQLVMGASFGMGARTLVSTKYCMNDEFSG